jgi:hypothetical protein
MDVMGGMDMTQSPHVAAAGLLSGCAPLIVSVKLELLPGREVNITAKSKSALPAG